MARTKPGGRRPNRANATNNNNNNNNKKNLENGLYVHSSPPKALNSNNGQGSATIRDYIRAADIEALEEVVLQGQGTKLVNQPATDTRVRNFLKTVPSYMSKIDLLHDAVEKGNLRDLKALLDRRKLARAKDSQGVGLLHKAVVHGHRGIVDYLIADYPETLNVLDNKTVLVQAANRVLETLPELPEDQSDSLTPPPTHTPANTPMHMISESEMQTKMEAWVEIDERVDDSREGRDEGVFSDSRLEVGLLSEVGQMGELVRLNAGDGMELEVAEWSQSDADGCYSDDYISTRSPRHYTSSSSSSSFSKSEQEITLELKESIRKMLSEGGSSGRLPRLPSPMPSRTASRSSSSSAKTFGRRQGIVRITNHSDCVNEDAVPPPVRSRGTNAYQSHIQRMSRSRRVAGKGNRTPQSRIPIYRHVRLPDIARRPQIKKRVPSAERPLTPIRSPLRSTSSSSVKVLRGKPRRINTIVQSPDADERLSAALSKMQESDSDSDNNDGDKRRKPFSSRQHTSYPLPATSVQQPVLPFAPTFSDNTHVESPEQLTSARLSGFNEARLSNSIQKALQTMDEKQAYIPKYSSSHLRAHTPDITPTYSPTPTLTPTLIHLESDSGFESPNAVSSLEKSGENAFENNRPLSENSLPFQSYLPGSSSSSSSDESSVTTSRRSSLASIQDLEVNEDLRLEIFSHASPSLQNYIHWLTARIVGEGFVNLKKVYARDIQRHESQIDVWNTVYNHDINYWAKVIVDRVLELVVNSMNVFDKERRILQLEYHTQNSGGTSSNKSREKLEDKQTRSDSSEFKDGSENKAFSLAPDDEKDKYSESGALMDSQYYLRSLFRSLSEASNRSLDEISPNEVDSEPERQSLDESLSLSAYSLRPLFSSPVPQKIEVELSSDSSQRKEESGNRNKHEITSATPGRDSAKAKLRSSRDRRVNFRTAELKKEVKMNSSSASTDRNISNDKGKSTSSTTLRERSKVTGEKIPVASNTDLSMTSKKEPFSGSRKKGPSDCSRKSSSEPRRESEENSFEVSRKPVTNSAKESTSDSVKVASAKSRQQTTLAEPNSSLHDLRDLFSSPENAGNTFSRRFRENSSTTRPHLNKDFSVLTAASEPHFLNDTNTTHISLESQIREAENLSLPITDTNADMDSNKKTLSLTPTKLEISLPEIPDKPSADEHLNVEIPKSQEIALVSQETSGNSETLKQRTTPVKNEEMHSTTTSELLAMVDVPDSSHENTENTVIGLQEMMYTDGDALATFGGIQLRETEEYTLHNSHQQNLAMQSTTGSPAEPLTDSEDQSSNTGRTQILQDSENKPISRADSFSLVPHREVDTSGTSELNTQIPVIAESPLSGKYKVLPAIEQSITHSEEEEGEDHDNEEMKNKSDENGDLTVNYLILPQIPLSGRMLYKSIADTRERSSDDYGNRSPGDSDSKGAESNPSGDSSQCLSVGDLILGDKHKSEGESQDEQNFSDITEEAKDNGPTSSSAKSGSENTSEAERSESANVKDFFSNLLRSKAHVSPDLNKKPTTNNSNISEVETSTENPKAVKEHQERSQDFISSPQNDLVQSEEVNEALHDNTKFSAKDPGKNSSPTNSSSQMTETIQYIPLPPIGSRHSEEELWDSLSPEHGNSPSVSERVSESHENIQQNPSSTDVTELSDEQRLELDLLSLNAYSLKPLLSSPAESSSVDDSLKPLLSSPAESSSVDDSLKPLLSSPAESSSVDDSLKPLLSSPAESSSTINPLLSSSYDDIHSLEAKNNSSSVIETEKEVSAEHCQQHSTSSKQNLYKSKQRSADLKQHSPESKEKSVESKQLLSNTLQCSAESKQHSAKSKTETSTSVTSEVPKESQENHAILDSLTQQQPESDPLNPRSRDLNDTLHSSKGSSDRSSSDMLNQSLMDQESLFESLSLSTYGLRHIRSYSPSGGRDSISTDLGDTRFYGQQSYSRPR